MTDHSNKLRAKGYKITPQRSLILNILHETQEHLTAEEIALRARTRQPHLAAGTVYRNLKTLCALGLIYCTNFQGKSRRYEINRGHHHHLICLRCGSTIEIDFCPMNNMISQITKNSGFKVTAHNFEITGYCKHCQKGGQ
jgi:Fe2+ or Zn2+ uptake regulation protein